MDRFRREGARITTRGALSRFRRSAGSDLSLEFVEIDAGSVWGRVEWGGINAELYASVKRARMDGFIATNNLARCLDSTEPKRAFDAHNWLLQAATHNALR